MLEPRLGSKLPKKTNLIPKETTRYSKNQKPAFSKTIKNTWFFKGCWLQRHLKKAPRKQRWLPEDTQKNPKPQRMEIQKWDQKFYKRLDPVFKHTLKHKQSKKKPKKTHCEDPLPPHLRDPNNAPPKSKREGYKKGLDWNYTLQKKGRDKGLIGVIRPYKV